MVGHSGGPVVDENGEVVAWNVRKAGDGMGELCELRPIKSGKAVIDAAKAKC